MKLSNNLSKKEVIKSNTAIRLSIDNEPTTEHLENLVTIADKVFQPLREYFEVPIYISSGYRSKALNIAIKGAISSHHCRGMALDIDQDGRSIVSNKMIFNYIKDYLEFTQLIFEYPDKHGNPAWVHVSYDKEDLRGEILESYKVNKRTKYKVWRS